MRPTLRTAFIIQRPNLVADSQPIKYGDEFLLTDTSGQVY